MTRSDPLQLYPGLRIGSVELASEVKPRETSGGRIIPQWEVLCDCGGRAYRTTHYLARAYRSGTDTSCKNCVQEARRGYFIDKDRHRRVGNTEYFVDLFQRTGSLYHSTSPEIKYDPAWSLQTTGVDRFSLNVRLHETDEFVNPDYHQQDQWIFPIKSHAGLICYYCGKPFTTGSGCVRCLTRMCKDCARIVEHRCPLNWMTTWEGESKDSGLLARRIKLLTQKPLVLLTQELVEKTKAKHLEEYQRWLLEQQEARLREEQRLREVSQKRALALKIAQRKKSKLADEAKKLARRLAAEAKKKEERARLKQDPGYRRRARRKAMHLEPIERRSRYTRPPVI